MNLNIPEKNIGVLLFFLTCVIVTLFLLIGYTCSPKRTYSEVNIENIHHEKSIPKNTR